MKQRNRDPLLLPPSQAAASSALSRAVNLRCSGSALRRGGATARARKLRDELGLDREDAAILASDQGKGHTAEIHQASTYTANNGSRRRRHRARPNPRANDPVIDVEVLRHNRVDGGRQVKVGQESYVARAVRSGKYPPPVVANAEACEALWEKFMTRADVDDRMRMHGGSSAQLRESEALEISSHALVRAMQNRRGLETLDKLAIMARAGWSDGLSNFVLVAATGIAKASSDAEVGQVFERALSAGLRATARTTLQAGYLVWRFDANARAQFSAGLVHRIGSESVAAGEGAEVIVETILDLVAVRRGEMDMSAFWSNLGIQTCRAAGGTAGALTMARLTRDAPWWVQGVAMLMGQVVGRELGTRAGQSLFGRGAT